MNREEWLAAVRGLTREIQTWVPRGVDVRPEPYPEDPRVSRLLFSEPQGSIRVTMEPAAWDRDHLPTSVDFYSNWGARFRFRGPDAQGKWTIYTADGARLPTPWTKSNVGALLKSLLSVS